MWPQKSGLLPPRHKDSKKINWESFVPWCLRGSNRLSPMSLQKIFPVITSIAIILIVAGLRDRSRALAAVLATMPINVPLALWVISSSSSGDPRQMADFARSLIISLIPTFIWLGIVFLAIRAGWGFFAAIGIGYGVWAALIAGLFRLGVLSWPK